MFILRIYIYIYTQRGQGIKILFESRVFDRKIQNRTSSHESWLFSFEKGIIKVEIQEKKQRVI